MAYVQRVAIPSAEGVFERDLSSIHFRDPKVERNRDTFLLLITFWVALLADSPCDAKKPNRVINQFLNELIDDPLGIIASYDEFAQRLAVSFKRTNDGISTEWIPEMADTPIFREYHKAFTTLKSNLDFQFIFSFLTFGKKIYYEDPDLDAIALRKWIEVEDRLAGVEIPAWVTNLKWVLSELFTDWDFDHFLPKHGSGAVAQRGVRGVEAKNNGFDLHPRIARTYGRTEGDYAFTGPVASPTLSFRNEVYGYTSTKRPHGTDRFSGEYDGIIWDTGSDAFGIPFPSITLQDGSLNASRLKFVPKSWKTSRSICMEPVCFQWAQQGVRLVYESYLQKSVLKNHVFLKDQGMNQRAAKFGSETGLVDTIDLSSASDSVLWDLVKRSFPAKVLIHLAATRTAIVELPNGELRKVLKFAPMGSALCFPVQSTIYSAIVMMVGIAKATGRDWMKPGCFDGCSLKDLYKWSFYKEHNCPDNHHQGFSQPFLCYGDDIICDKQLTVDVVRALTELGFQVNEEKSFTGASAYRESCGKHYVDGVDVTPHYFKSPVLSARLSHEALANFIDMANRSYDRGYMHLRKHVIAVVLHHPIEGIRDRDVNPILFSNDRNDSFALYHPEPRNTHLRMREYHADKVSDDSRYHLQRNEYRSLGVRPRDKVKSSEHFDDYYHTLWWRARYGDRKPAIDDGGISRTDALAAGIGWRWTAS